MILRLLFCATLLLAILAGAITPAAAGKKPFYIIAHRINQPDWIEPALALGANAIEMDVQCSGGRLVINHDFTDGVPVALEDYLSRLRVIAHNNPRLALVVFDTKRLCHKQDNAAVLFAAIRKHGPRGVNIVVSVSSFKLAHKLFQRMPDRKFRPREAVAIDEQHDVGKVSRLFRQAGFHSYAFGDGIFETCPCPWVISAVEQSVSEAARHRSRYGFRYVYTWTLGRESSMRYFLKAGVDGVLVNWFNIEKFAGVLREFTATHRLGTR